MANNSLIELNRRHCELKNKYNDTKNVYLIKIHDYLKENYKKTLLFYSMNHPSKYIFQYISEEIINILQIKNTIDYDIDDLSCLRCIIYKCIQKNVEFDISKHTPLICNETNINSITKIYYDFYGTIDMTKI